MPPKATGRDATLNDMIAWPNAIAIMGTHDARSSICVGCDDTVADIDRLPEEIAIDATQFGQLVFYPSGDEISRSSPIRCDKNCATSCPLTLLPASSNGGA